MFFQKQVYVKRKKNGEYGYEKRGVCLGVYVSNKTGLIKSLLCSIDDEKTVHIPISQMERIDEKTVEAFLYYGIKEVAVVKNND